MSIPQDLNNPYTQCMAEKMKICLSEPIRVNKTYCHTVAAVECKELYFWDFLQDQPNRKVWFDPQPNRKV